MKKVRIMYGLGDFYGGASIGIISLLFMFFLTDVAGISPAYAGIIVFIGRVVDAVIDPFLGPLSDRTRSKLGRRVPFFIRGAIPVIFSFILLWLVPPVSSQLLVLYYAVIYAFFSASFSYVMIPYTALAPELTPVPAERNALISTRMACSILGGLVAAVVPSIIIATQKDIKTGYLLMAAPFGIVFGTIWFAMFGVMKGREKYPETPNSESFLRTVRQVFKNKSFLILICIYLFAFIPNDITGANFKYFLNYYLLRENSFSLVVGTTMVCAVLSLPLYLTVMKRIGKPKTMLWGSVFRSLVLLSYLLLTPETPMWLILVLSVCNGIGMGASYAIPWAMLPEVTDLDQAVNGTRNEGAYSGVMTFIRQLSSAFAMLALGIVLEWSGYIADAAVQEPSAVSAIRLTTILVPLGLSVLTAFFAVRFPINHKNIGGIRRVLAAREDGSFERLPKAEQAHLLNAMLEERNEG